MTKPKTVVTVKTKGDVAKTSSRPVRMGNDISTKIVDKYASGKFVSKSIFSKKARNVKSDVDSQIKSDSAGSLIEEKHKNKFEVVEDPNIQLGLPTIKGTRWPIRDIVELVESDGLEDTLKSFRSLSEEMVKFAINYVKKHPEIMRNS